MGEPEDAGTTTDAPAGPTSSAGSRVYRTLRGASQALHGHPLITVAVVASAVALGHAVWVLTHRRVGALDPDEAGYIADAMRFHRSIDPRHPLEFVRSVLSSGTGPLVPLLAVPMLLVGPRNPLTVMMVQPVLLVVTCVAITGITRRMASDGAAIVTGCAFLAFPTASLATQSFWLGLGATTCISLAMWALTSSDRLTNRWAYAFGAGVACTVLARTMAIAFVPGLLAAGAVVAGRQRRSWIGLLKALAVAVVVAGPWYLLQSDAIFGYLIDYGYGERAGLFGSGGPLDRLSFRYDRISGDIGTTLTITALIIACTAIPVVWFRWRRNGEAPRGIREFAALSTVVAAGLAALVSTSNNGVWFELPLIALLTAMVGALAARAWWPLRAALVLQLIGQGLIALAVTWWLVSPRLGLTAHYEYGFAQYDERYEQGHRDEQPAAAADWRQLNERVERRLRALDGGTGDGALFEVSGNMQLFNSNTLSLAAEQQGWGPSIRIPDTTVGRSELLRELAPTGYGRDGRLVERVIVVALHDRILFTPDAEVDRFAVLAMDRGWRASASEEMPGGGEVLILRHPDGDG